MKKQIGVVLCGSGYKDGSEIRESVATLWALSQLDVSVQIYAPNADQSDVVNCLTGQPMPGEKRNQLIEAARIARGNVKPLSELKPGALSAIILPGGFGAAKNLCNFAQAGAEGAVLPELKSVLEAIHQAGKPIGAICIAPAIVALAFKGQGFELTVGEPCGASEEIEKLGHRHVSCAVDSCHVDRRSKIVTTPAYMYDDAPLHQVFAGIQALTHEVLKLT